MKLKKTDHYTKIYKLLNARLLTIADYERLRDGSKDIKLPKNVLSFTLLKYTL